MNYDYVDIGTCDFEFSNYLGDIKILLVEPLQEYLANIPDNFNRIKANYAISDYIGTGKIHCVHLEDIKNYDLSNHIRGCNSLNSNHITTELELKSKNLLHLYKTIEVNVITFEKLVEIYNITSIGKLKIDAEGHDHIILDAIYNYVLKNNLKIKAIQYEYYANNIFQNAKNLETLAEKFKTDLNYNLRFVDSSNVILEKL
jgi:FkbM family methyltransferase